MDVLHHQGISFEKQSKLAIVQAFSTAKEARLLPPVPFGLLQPQGILRADARVSGSTRRKVKPGCCNEDERTVVKTTESK